MIFSRQGQLEGSNVAKPGPNSGSAKANMGSHALGMQEAATISSPG